MPSFGCIATTSGGTTSKRTAHATRLYGAKIVSVSGTFAPFRPSTSLTKFFSVFISSGALAVSPACQRSIDVYAPVPSSA